MAILVFSQKRRQAKKVRALPDEYWEEIRALAKHDPEKDPVIQEFRRKMARLRKSF